jgi:hypothetical protein
MDVITRVYIPIATRQDVHFMIKNRITAQTIHPDIVICNSLGEINSQNNYSPERIVGEACSRNLCIDAFLHSTEDAYFLHQCSDIGHIDITDFEHMINKLQSNSKAGICELKFNQDLSVETIACIVMRREVLEKGFRFVNKYKKCLCKETFESILAMGYEKEYITGRLLIIR